VIVPGTRREVLSIYRTMTGHDYGAAPSASPERVAVLLGADATREALFRLAPRARYLHIATHHLPDETEHASYSSLALTPTAAGDDGFLRLDDVLEHWRGRLTHCALVVLSACETQRGELQRDEAVFAMPVGFQYAGAPAVIASLWKVDDASTADLMVAFYRRLAKGKDALTALQGARKEIRRTHPAHHWAPFIHIGASD